jgi:tetratricopeptide (TPR) repeat protein
MTSALQQGIDSAKAGMMEEALAHLKDAIVEEPENANVWVWLSAIIEDEEKQTVFLKKALEIDPENRPAQRGLAFIQRKKYIPPKDGEKLSDYTRPIGIFKTPDARTPAQAAAAINAGVQAEAARPTPQLEKPVFAPAPASTAKPHKAWLDVLLYGLTLMVFVVIGILVGKTLLNINLPFLAKPTPVLAELPPSEGIYVKVGNEYQEMKLKLGKPSDTQGLPQLTLDRPELVLFTNMVSIESIKFLDGEGKDVPFLVTPAEQNSTILHPKDSLKPGQYCIVHTLDPVKNQMLYWCLDILQP